MILDSVNLVRVILDSVILGWVILGRVILGWVILDRVILDWVNLGSVTYPKNVTRLISETSHTGPVMSLKGILVGPWIS